MDGGIPQGSKPEIALDGDTLTLTETDATIILVDRTTVAKPRRRLRTSRPDVESLVTVDAVSSGPAGQ